MTVRFLHTADWQLGKPFGRINDHEKRVLLQQERFSVISRIAATAGESGARFVLVAGDLFDSSSVSKSTVSAACGAIGKIPVPVFVIPGNHDHGGPGSVWEQDYFKREHQSLAPNLTILLKPEPLELDSAVIFPCPLMRRSELTDPTSWLRSIEPNRPSWDGKARIVLAHGSSQGFSSLDDEDEFATAASNRINLDHLGSANFDYIALGDWHGTKQITPNAWYSGTPEVDRFPKGDANTPGHALVVVASRSDPPSVSPVRTARLGWHQTAFDFVDDSSLELLQSRMEDLLQTRTNTDLLQLSLTGSLGIEASRRLEQYIEQLEARLLRLKLSSQVTIAPTESEIAALTQRPTDPLIARVATRLYERALGSDESAAIARIALRELHGSCHTR